MHTAARVPSFFWPVTKLLPATVPVRTLPAVNELLDETVTVNKDTGNVVWAP